MRVETKNKRLKIFSVQMQQALLDELDEAAKDQNLSRSALVRRFVVEGLGHVTDTVKPYHYFREGGE